MALDLEHHLLDLRYADLRSTSRRREKHLLASLAQNGQLVPVVTVPEPETGRYVLIDGYKRVRALERLRIDVVSAMVWELEEADALIFERLLRRRHEESALEQGWVLQELKERFKLSHSELARRFDVSCSWVSRRLALVMALPSSVHEAVRNGQVVAHAAAKYLVPLARANEEHATKLCASIGPLSLSSREVGVLYAAYQQGDAESRQLLIEHPEVVLRAEKEIDGGAADVHPDPVEQLLRDARVLCAVARRLHQGASRDLVGRLSQPQRYQLDQAVMQTHSDVQAVQAILFDKEHHA